MKKYILTVAVLLFAFGSVSWADVWTEPNSGTTEAPSGVYGVYSWNGETVGWNVSGNDSAWTDVVDTYSSPYEAGQQVNGLSHLTFKGSGTAAGNEIGTGENPGYDRKVAPSNGQVPEPTTLILYGLGFAGAGLYRRLRRKNVRG